MISYVLRFMAAITIASVVGVSVTYCALVVGHNVAVRHNPKLRGSLPSFPLLFKLTAKKLLIWLCVVAIVIPIYLSCTSSTRL